MAKSLFHPHLNKSYFIRVVVRVYPSPCIASSLYYDSSQFKPKMNTQEQYQQALKFNDYQLNLFLRTLNIHDLLAILEYAESASRTIPNGAIVFNGNMELLNRFPSHMIYFSNLSANQRAKFNNCFATYIKTLLSKTK